jgi:hypothetical protein
MSQLPSTFQSVRREAEGECPLLGDRRSLKLVYTDYRRVKAAVPVAIKVFFELVVLPPGIPPDVRFTEGAGVEASAVLEYLAGRGGASERRRDHDGREARYSLLQRNGGQRERVAPIVGLTHGPQLLSGHSTPCGNRETGSCKEGQAQIRETPVTATSRPSSRATHRTRRHERVPTHPHRSPNSDCLIQDPNKNSDTVDTRFLCATRYSISGARDQTGSQNMMCVLWTLRVGVGETLEIQNNALNARGERAVPKVDASVQFLPFEFTHPSASATHTLPASHTRTDNAVTAVVVVCVWRAPVGILIIP